MTTRNADATARRRRSVRRSGAARVGLGVALLSLLGIAACGESVRSTNHRPSASAVWHTPALETRRLAPSWPMVRSVGDDTSPAVRTFKTFALNALLLPLLDDDLPPRWANPTQSLDCEDGHVTIDGRRLDIGAPVPRQAFVVRWHLQHCESLDGYFDFSGEVELRVEPRTGGFTAEVNPTGVQLASQYGVERLEGKFVAHLNVGP